MKEQRLRRAQERLGSQDFDGFISGSSSTVEYLTGFRSMAAQIYEDSEVFVVLGADSFALVLPFGQVAAAIDAGVDPSRIFAFGAFFYFGDPAHAVQAVPRCASLEDALREARRMLGGAARLGIDHTRLSVTGARAIEHGFGSLPAVDATAWIKSVRSVKTPDEVALLRRSAQASERGIAAALAAAGPGSTEREIAEIVAATMVAEGGQPAFLSVQTGPRGGLGDAHPGDRGWQKGEFLRLDVGCLIDGYWSDIARTAYLGEPTVQQRRTFEALRTGQRFELDTIRPGIRARDLFDETRTIIRSSGLPDFERHHCGHGIGLSIYDAPGITEIDDSELQEGMVLCLEVPYYALGEGGILTEDTVVLTADGCESFTTLSRELHVVN
jgi:Xaa-Pro aminopeptidase